jgi:hypothetical protein
MMVNNMDTITLLIGALATARLTRLVTTDRITQGPRGWALRRLKEGGLLAYLVVCDWCVSVYIGGIVVGAILLGGQPGFWVLAALAFSYVAGWLARGEVE